MTSGPPDGGAFAAEQYKMVAVPKLRAPWFNEFEKGLLKAGKDFGVNPTSRRRNRPTRPCRCG